MEKFKSYNIYNYKMEPKLSSKKYKKDLNERNLNPVKKHITTHKRKNTNKDNSSAKNNLNESQNNSVKSKNRRTYTKRTDLIQERIKILQLAKKNIDIKDNIYEEDNNNKRTELSSSNRRIIITDNKNDSYKELKNNVTVQNNNCLINTLKNQDNEKNNLLNKNLITNDNKYIKKIPVKSYTNSAEKKPNFRKYETSTFFYNKSKKNILIKNNEKYNNNTYFNDNLFRNNSNVKRRKKDNDNEKVNDMDIIGYKTGFVYHNKIMKTRLNFEDSSSNSPSKINSYVFKKPKSKNKSINNKDLLIHSPNNVNDIKSPNINKIKSLNNINNIKSPNINNIKSPNINNINNINNIKEVKDEYDSENDLSNNKEKELNNIYIPKKIHHLIHGTSQEDIHNINQKKYVSSNTSLKDRYKSYKRINNYSNNNKNNNINININNNIKIITYNKKKPSWKNDKKEKNIDVIDQNFDDEERLDIFKENISDISSIESRSNIESETTENNNKLNVYLNNIYKTKSIFHPKLYKKKKNSTTLVENDYKDSINNNNKYTVNTQKTNTNIISSRNVSVPHFIFKKRITKDMAEYNRNSSAAKKNNNNNNNKQVMKNVNSMKSIKIENNNKDKYSEHNEHNEHNELNDINEPKFDELVIINEKLKNINDGIYTNSIILNYLCFDFLNNFYQSSILYIIEKLFQNKNLKIIKNYLKYLVFSIIILYNYYSTESMIEENDKFLIQEIFSLNYQNLLYLYEYIISKVKSKNIWANCIKEIIHNYKRQKKNIYSANTNLYFQSVFDKIKNNTKYIRQIINRVFINSNDKKTNDIIIAFLKELDNKTFVEIKNCFIKNVYQKNKIYGYIYPFYLYNDINKEFIKEKPFLKKREKSKKYTLILGLEEIIINLKLEDELVSKGTLYLRPGLISFLKEIQKYYEIIIFSLSENKIADYLINAIEKRNKFFDYKLYRENLSIVNEEFVIDLNQIDRPLYSIIIISNIPQIYQNNKENAINIKSYWKEDLNDSILNKLAIILKNIADEEGDAREMLLEYKDEIIKKVTIGSFEY